MKHMYKKIILFTTLVSPPHTMLEPSAAHVTILSKSHNTLDAEAKIAGSTRARAAEQELMALFMVLLTSVA